PRDRQSVQTYVMEHDWGIVIEAISKEMRRGGQVYYLHNRIESIDRTAAKLQQFLPDARIGIGHGQMSEEELSVVWQKLLDEEIDILVCTTIIENGIDLPNINTLIVEDCDRFGLAQLHQIRGRIGRSSARAFAYLTYRRGKVLNETVTKRLLAIKEFTKFGSGFQIAMRDLEIRGAGNLLGAQQHGHLHSVGYDMYIRLLEEAINEETGNTGETKIDCMMDLFIGAHIPEKYISNLEHRIDIYKKISTILTEEEKSDMIDELIDRFGDPPQEILSLIEISMLRNFASSLKFSEISQRTDGIAFYPSEFNPKTASTLSEKYKRRYSVHAGLKPYYFIRSDKTQPAILLIKEVLNALLN
ncbi:MAG: helicase-related protein, partial [Candidatus Pacebacteria bacterium]|nr:helicase-related protein [Candidatus Paceibacterota bacterium]